MALINGNDYDHIDFTKNGVTTRHMLKDTLSRQMSGDLVKVQNEEPTSEGTKIWIKPSGDSEVQVPTYEEFEALSDKIDDADATITPLAVGAQPTVSVTEVDGHKRFSFGIPASNGIASITKTATDGVIDTYTIAMTDGTSTSFSVNNSDITPESMAEAIATALQDYAKIDGYYPDLTAGNADQLNSTKFVENKEPYLYRPSGGTSDIGNREYLDAVVGGTIAWNQLVQNGNFAEIGGWGVTQTVYETSVSNNVLTAKAGPSATASSAISAEKLNTVAGHKYLASIDVKYSKVPAIIQGSKFFFGSGGYDGISGVVTAANTWQQIAGVFTRGTGGSDKVAIYPRYSTAQGEEGETAQFRNAVIFDLTQMFGTAVANYIYNLETATAGAGVALFRKLFPDDYYEYNPGELKHVEGLSAHEMVGFNQWDWQTNSVLGELIDATNGSFVPSSSFPGQCWRSGYIKVFPNTRYYISGFGNGCFNIACYYDADRNYLSRTGGEATNTRDITTPRNCSYIAFTLYKVNTSQTFTDNRSGVCINLAHNNSSNGEYEPYEKHSYPLDSTVVLRGIPKVGANGVYWDGDRYLPDGTVERRYGVADLGTLEWIVNSAENNILTATVPNIAVVPSDSYPNRREGAICSKYQPSGNISISANMDDKAWLRLSGAIFIRDTSYTDPAAFKAAMSGVYLVYELATPTTEQAQPYHSTQWVSDWGTEEFVSTGIVPVGHETRYPANLRDKLQHLPDAASGNGSYLITQTDGQMVLTPFPAPPSTAGNYVLKATVVNGVATYTWEVAT